MRGRLTSLQLAEILADAPAELQARAMSWYREGQSNNKNFPQWQRAGVALKLELAALVLRRQELEDAAQWLLWVWAESE